MAKSSAQTAAENYNTDNDDELESVLEYSEDISEAERPQPLPVGTYDATVTDVVKKVGKESGRPYLFIKFSIGRDSMPADYVEALGDIDTKTVSGMFFIAEDNPQSRFNAKRFCEALGAPMSRRLNYSEWKGMECKVLIEHQPNLEGDPQERVRNVVRS